MPALVLAAGMGILLCACAAPVHIRGNSPDPRDLAKIEPGVQTRDQVVQLLGSPTSVATFDKHTIYYISQRMRTVAFQRPETLSREVVAIKFDDNGVVKDVKKLTLADARNINPVDRTTPTPGRQFTVLEQLLGNLGRFSDQNAPTK